MSTISQVAGTMRPGCTSSARRVSRSSGTVMMPTLGSIVQNGKKSDSNTTVRGVLRDRAKKIFRGTIDFQNGAAGASGTEQENVLLLDETVVNKTVPVILCAEEDVAGSHGATIGQIDPGHIFYMQSRGIPEAQIYEILAHSQLGSIVNRIGDAETEQTVCRMLGRESEDA